jgi:hypothetical protein
MIRASAAVLATGGAFVLIVGVLTAIFATPGAAILSLIAGLGDSPHPERLSSPAVGKHFNTVARWDSL